MSDEPEFRYRKRASFRIPTACCCESALQTRPASPVWQHNRAILAHFNPCSAALNFVLWPTGSLLTPLPLPPGARVRDDALPPGPQHDPQPVLQAARDHLGADAEDITSMSRHDSWIETPEGPIRIHLLRFASWAPPQDLLDYGGGRFRHIAALRHGYDFTELQLLRKVFNFMLSGEA